MAYHVWLSTLYWLSMADICCNSHNEMKGLRCMSYTNKGNAEIVVAGLQDQIFVIDVEKGSITKKVP